MIGMYRLHCGLLFCCNSPKETSSSLVLRVSGLVLAILSVLASALILSNTPWLVQAGTPAGWSLFAAGSLLLSLSLCISCEKKRKASLAPLPPSTKQIDDSTGVVQQYGLYQVLLPSLHELPLKEGYQHSEILDFETIESRLDTLIILAGSPKNLQKLNIFPLPYRLEQENHIVPDFDVLRRVFAKPITVISTEKKIRYVEGYDPLAPWRQKEPVVFSSELFRSWSSHELNSLPGYRFFIAHNGVQLEIGYIQIGKTPYKLLDDDTIKLMPEITSGGNSGPPLLN